MANELPNREQLTGGENLLDCGAVNDSFFNYPGHCDNLLDGLVVGREKLDPEPPHRLCDVLDVPRRPSEKHDTLSVLVSSFDLIVAQSFFRLT